MSKKKRNLILMLAATLVMGGLLWILMQADAADVDHTHSSDTSDTSEEEDNSGTLIDEAQEDLQKIVFSNEKAKYTATVDSEAGEVVFSELKGLPVNSTFMEYIWYGVAQMSYYDVVTTTDAEDYKAADYGLDEPALTVTATFEGGKKYKYYAGNQVPGQEDDVFYVLLDGDKNVYSCALDTAFFMGNNYFLSDDVFYTYDKDLENESDITIGNITLSGDEFNGKFVMKVNRESNKSNPFCGYDYVVTSPINWPAKLSSSALLVHELTYMTASDAVVLNPTKKQLKQYGLDTPSVTISFTRNGKACTLYCGNITKTAMYVMLKDQPIIYELDVDGLDMLNKLSPETIYSDRALSISVETISAIKIKTSDFTKSISVSREDKSTGASESTDDTALYTYSVKADGKDKEYSAYVNLVKQINNGTVQKWNVKKPSGKAEVTVTISYFDNFKREDDVIKFYKYNDRTYAVVWGDYPINTVSATWLNQMLDNAQEF